MKCWAFGDQQGTCYVEVKGSRASAGGGDIGAGQLLCSLRVLPGMQLPSLPKTVTDVSWSVSAGRVTQSPGYMQTIVIDTTGLSGQKINVIASVEGYGERCPYTTVAGSFIAKRPGHAANPARGRKTV